MKKRTRKGHVSFTIQDPTDKARAKELVQQRYKINKELAEISQKAIKKHKEQKKKSKKA